MPCQALYAYMYQPSSISAGHRLDGSLHASMMGEGCRCRGPQGVLEGVGFGRPAGPRLLKAQPSPNYLVRVLLKLVAMGSR